MAETHPKKKEKEPRVYALSRASRCYNCDTKLLPGRLVKLKQEEEEREVLCAHCANLDSLEFLRSGSTKITHLAKKYSTQCFVVVQWSELWKCYERKGILVEPVAIDRAIAETGISLTNRETVTESDHSISKTD